MAARRDRAAGSKIYLVRNSAEEKFSVDLPAEGTVWEAKAQLSRKMNYPASNMILAFCEDVLTDNTSLEAAHVDQSTGLRLEFRDTPLVDIIVRLPTDQVVKFRVPEDACRDMMMSELQIKEPTLNVKSMALIHIGLELESDIPAKDLEGETLLAHMLLPGGNSSVRS